MAHIDFEAGSCRVVYFACLNFECAAYGIFAKWRDEVFKHLDAFVESEERKIELYDCLFIYFFDSWGNLLLIY